MKRNIFKKIIHSFRPAFEKARSKLRYLMTMWNANFADRQCTEREWRRFDEPLAQDAAQVTASEAQATGSHPDAGKAGASPVSAANTSAPGEVTMPFNVPGGRTGVDACEAE